MKKLFVLLVILSSYYGFSQKTVYIFNATTGTTLSIDIGELQTIANGGGYPRFRSLSPLITIPPGGQYILENTSSATRFPFLSPASIPQITSWGRQSVSGGAFVATSSSLSYTGYGNGQKFNFLKFQVGANGSLGGGNLGLSFPSTITGNGWSADYSVNTDPSNPNLQETVIILY